MTEKQHNWGNGKNGGRLCRTCFLAERETEDGRTVWTWRKNRWDSGTDAVPPCPPRGA